MINSVEDDEFDVQSGLQSAWAVTFCILYILVMVIRCVDISKYIYQYLQYILYLPASLVFYLVTVRAVALEVRAHNTTYLLVMLLFFAAVIEFGVIVGGDISCQLVSEI